MFSELLRAYNQKSGELGWMPTRRAARWVTTGGRRTASAAASLETTGVRRTVSTAAAAAATRRASGRRRTTRCWWWRVATLITALTYQLGTNIPGGYWQDDDADGSHAAGDPIVRDKHQPRYWLFMAASWAGFGSSMLLTLGLFTGVPSLSRAVQWPFLVAYSSLVLTFITSQLGTSLAMDVLIWAAVMAVLAVGIKYRRLDRLRFLFCPPAP